jgi:hypothetical protein
MKPCSGCIKLAADLADTESRLARALRALALDEQYGSQPADARDCFICGLVATAPVLSSSDDPVEAHRAGIAAGATIMLGECVAGHLADVRGGATTFAALCDHHRGWLRSLVGLLTTIARERMEHEACPVHVRTMSHKSER